MNKPMKSPWRRRAAMSLVASAALLAGCRAEPITPALEPAPNNASVDLDAGLSAAFDLRQPVLVLIAERGHSADDQPDAASEDDKAIALLEDAAVKTKLDRITPVLIDLGISRNRATAARFHITDFDTPMLVCLTPRGLILSRDEK